MQLFYEFPDGSYRAHNATVVADVTVGRQTSFWFNTIARGDVAPIRIGQRVNIQDGAILHVDAGIPNIIEDDVSIAHGAIIHGAHVGAGSLIGIHATLLRNTRVGKQCLVAAGAVVPPNMVIPDRHMAAGVPARVIRPVRESEIEYLAAVTARYLEMAQQYLNNAFPGAQPLDR